MVAGISDVRCAFEAKVRTASAEQQARLSAERRALREAARACAVSLQSQCRGQASVSASARPYGGSSSSSGSGCPSSAGGMIIASGGSEAAAQVASAQKLIQELRARAERAETEKGEAEEEAARAQAEVRRLQLKLQAKTVAIAAARRRSSLGTSAAAAAATVVAKGAKGGKGASRQRGAPKPPVPAFQRPVVPPPRPEVLLRRIKLPPPRPEDNYEISDREEVASDDGEAPPSQEEIDRSAKAVPRWCETYLEDLAKQEDVDPDTIFGARVPVCNLEIVFPDELCRAVGRDEPVKRKRGSSGEWKDEDRLGKQEVCDYKRRMGQRRAWDVAAEIPANSPAASASSLGPED